jgi:IMP dehydrogenase
MQKYYTFDDVLFKPKYSDIPSRSMVDVSSCLGSNTFNLPIASANMRDITGTKMAIEMAKNGGLGILHRFFGIEESVDDFLMAAKELEEIGIVDPEYKIGVSVGVNEDDKLRFERLVDSGARIICIDVAHGHHLKMKNMLSFIVNQGKKDLCVIAGNIATVEGAKDLIEWGATVVKAGIGPGAVCQTRVNTGVGVPQLGLLDELRSEIPDMVLMSDGGVKSTGDAAKALKFSNMVMVGSMLSGTSETPGNVYENDKGQFYKTYGGSASAENKVKSGNANQFIEGVMKTVPFRGHAKHILRKMKQNLQSSFSYSGAWNIEQFHEKAEFIFITGAGKNESKL